MARKTVLVSSKGRGASLRLGGTLSPTAGGEARPVSAGEHLRDTVGGNEVARQPAGNAACDARGAGGGRREQLKGR